MGGNVVFSIFYFDRYRLYIFTPFTSQIFYLDYPPQTIADLEILSRDELERKLGEFIQTNKIAQAITLILLSHDYCFVKDIPNPTNDNNIVLYRKTETQKFLDMVPFEQVSSKVIDIPNGVRIIAINETFYLAIKAILEKFGFTIELIASPIVLNQDSSVFANGLTPEVVGIIQQNIHVLKQYEFVTKKPEIMVHPVVETQPKAQAPSKKRNNMMILAFIFIIIFFAFLVFILAKQFGDAKLSPKTSALYFATSDTFTLFHE